MSPLRLILVDDNPDDRALALRALRQEWPDLSAVEVIDEAGFARLLAGPSHDLVLSDYQIRWTNGLEVLRAVKQRWPHCPVILFTGTGSEEIAVEAMKAGLDDYVIKQRGQFWRLPPAVRSVLQRAEERASARAAAERIRLLLESVPECVKTVDRECRLLQMNAAGLRMIEGEEQDSSGKSLLDLILPEHREAFRSLVQQVFRGESGTLEFEIEGLKGRRRWVQSQMVPLRDPKGEISEAMGVTLDLTERHKAEQALRAKEELFRRVLTALPVGLWVLDCNGHIVHGNPAGNLIWAGMRDTGRGRYCEYKGWWAGTDRRIESEEWVSARALKNGEAAHKVPVDIEAFDGTRKRILCSAEPLRDEAGAITGALVIFEDVSAQHQAEQTLRQRERELRHAQKLEALGRLAGGVAHDFNNLLTGILGFSELVLRTFDESDARRGQVLEVQQAGKRAAALTRQLLAFSRRQELEPAVFDLNALVRGLSSMLAPLIGEQIEITFELQPELGRVRADPGQIELVLLNLALNARDAMQGRGTLEIRTRNLALDEQAARDRGVPPGPFVSLQVRDTGCGMTPETLDQIFEPFFTTKPPGKGTGLGLSTAHGIVEQSGGHISAASVPEMGSTFTVLLPRVEAELEAARPAPSSEGASLGGKTVLVVEDENVVLDLILAVLSSSGCGMLAATSPEEALRLCREHEGAIDLCLIDVIMPGLSGPEVLAQIRALRPRTKALFMSGHSKRAFSRAGLALADIDLLRKPFAPSELVARVRQALDR